MKPGRIAAWAVAAVAVPGLAACSGTSSGSSPASSASSSPAGSQPASSQPAGQGQAAGSASLTPPGAHLAFGGPATVGWVPPAQDTGTGAHHGIKLRVTVVSIQKGQALNFVVTNDNNFPFSVGRHAGSGKPDDDEMIVLKLPQAVNAQ